MKTERPNSTIGIKEVISTSFPLMLSCLSSYLTMFIDRCFLTHYSLAALDATVNASTLCWAFFGGACVMAGMAEMFVAQFNGAGNQKFIGESVWQMIWFSIFTSFIFLPIGWFGSHFFYPTKPLEAEYFRWIMSFGGLQPLSYALTTFFVGRRKIKWIVGLALLSMLLNALLDYVLIFGIQGYISSIGVKGAAIANCLTLSLQVIILMIFFLRKHNREHCGTSNWQINLKTFWRSCQVTAPPAILYNIELIGWSVFYSLMTDAGHMHITIASICQGLILLFSFIGDGLCRGASVIANTLIGSGRSLYVKKVFQSSLYILLTIFAIQLLLLGIKPAIFVKTCLPDYEELSLFSSSLESCFFLVLLFLFFQSLQWVTAGILYAFGETLFVMISGACAMWCCLILPIYLFISNRGFSPSFAWIIVVLYSISTLSFYFWRLRQVTEKMSFPTNKIYRLNPRYESRSSCNVNGMLLVNDSSPKN